MKKIIATAAAAASVALATPAQAHVSFCDKTMWGPEKIHNAQRVHGVATIRCPRDGHHTLASVDAWIEVYAPRWDRWGDGDWRRLGYVHEDDDKYFAQALPNSTMLCATQTYRVRAKFTVHGPDGPRNYDIKTSGRSFTHQFC